MVGSPQRSNSGFAELVCDSRARGLRSHYFGRIDEAPWLPSFMPWQQNLTDHARSGRNCFGLSSQSAQGRNRGRMQLEDRSGLLIVRVEASIGIVGRPPRRILEPPCASDRDRDQLIVFRRDAKRFRTRRRLVSRSDDYDQFWMSEATRHFRNSIDVVNRGRAACGTEIDYHSYRLYALPVSIAELHSERLQTAHLAQNRFDPIVTGQCMRERASRHAIDLGHVRGRGYRNWQGQVTARFNRDRPGTAAECDYVVQKMGFAGAVRAANPE